MNLRRCIRRRRNVSNDVVVRKPIRWLSNESILMPGVWEMVANNNGEMEYTYRLKTEIVRERGATFRQLTETKTIRTKIEDRKPRWYHWR